MTFGERLRALRTVRGLSRWKLGRLANVDKRFISMMENDKVLPNAKCEGRLRKVLGWDYETEQALEVLMGGPVKGPA
ncbi:MAG TPA: helix-turn-helix transcriptional regulator [Anaerolineae bacterium]|nr:helix-turn-helix transcriptional regulator [Anaerolineae bacterium]